MKETKYTVKYTTSFKKDYKRAIKRGLKIELLEQVVALLAMGEPLPDKVVYLTVYLVSFIFRRMGKPVRRFFCMQRYVVKRDALDRGTPKRGSLYRSGPRS